MLAYSLLFLMLVVTTFNYRFDNTNHIVTYYPSSFVLTTNPKPIFFFHDTHLLHLTLDLYLLNLMPAVTDVLSPTNCTRAQYNFLAKTLRAYRYSSRRLYSLPGFTNLIECPSFLRKAYKFYSKLTPTMTCPYPFFRTTTVECKKAALSKCKRITNREKYWLKRTPRVRRSSFLCHFGALGIARAIYTAFGGNCEPNHVTKLKTSLKDILGLVRNQNTLDRKSVV